MRCITSLDHLLMMCICTQSLCRYHQLATIYSDWPCCFSLPFLACSSLGHDSRAIIVSYYANHVRNDHVMYVLALGSFDIRIPLFLASQFEIRKSLVRTLPNIEILAPGFLSRDCPPRLALEIEALCNIEARHPGKFRCDGEKC